MAKKIDFKTIKTVRKNNPSLAKNLMKKLKRKGKKSDDKTSGKTNAQVLKENLKKYFVKFEKHLKNSEDLNIDYIIEDEDVGEFNDVFEKFNRLENSALDINQTEESAQETQDTEEFEDSDSEDEDKSNKRMSSKKLFKLMNRPTLAQLKQAADKPEVVEIWDTTAADPKFLVWLKGQRNSVPVPGHWGEKTRYMQGKSSFDKPAYTLPPYIEATKISEIRAALQEKEAEKSLKQKQREKVRPKSHRMDIDYQTLHDAFFKYATKPSMTKYGDIYYEGKEMVLRMRKYKPGQLSARLKQALGVGENAPPPWLVNMQRFGPPPSYPNLRIPGVNAPLPESATFGYHAGGWGELPVDEHGNPLFGFIDSTYYEDGHIDKSLWGELPPYEEESEKSESEEEEDIKADESKDGIQSVIAPLADTPLSLGIKTPLVDVGLGGFETPIELGIAPRKPYTVLQPKVATNKTGALFGSQVTYQMPPPVATPLGISGLSTPFGGITTPSLTVDDTDGTSTTDHILRQLKYHENKAQKAKEAAGQIDLTSDGMTIKKTKKKKEFKF